MEYKDLWPTTFGVGKFECPEMLDYILSNYDLNNMDAISDILGFNIFDDDHPAIDKFKELCLRNFDEYLQRNVGRPLSDWGGYSLKSWITGHGKDYNMVIHNHAGSVISAVYYLLAEEKKFGGEVVFTDPRSNANRGYDEKFRPMFQRFHHMPDTGDYLIFPSFCYHHVNPYTSSLRFCLPVDLFLHTN